MPTVQQSGDLRWKSLVLSRRVREHGLSGQHLQETTQAAQERDFARLAVLVRLRATEFGQQLDFSPVEADPQVEEKARCEPAQGD